MFRQNRWLGLLLVAILAVSTACGGSGGEESDKGAEKQSQSAEKGSSASGMKDVPAVVAEVNGEEIGKGEFVQAYQAQAQQAAMQQPQSGQKPDPKQLRGQVVQSLVTQELLNQEADKRNITASDKQVQKTLDDLAQQNGLKSSDQLIQALEKQGMDRKEIKAQASMQTRLDQLLAEEAGDVSASDKEIKAMYKQLKAQQAQAGAKGQKMPPLAKVRPQLEDQVESQKESQAARGLIDKLRKGADIKIHV